VGREVNAVREQREGTSSSVPEWASESAGWIAALLLALLAIAHLAATDRSWMLYYDSETVLPALVRGSVLAGQPQDWALSAVLFIPEMGLYFAVAALGLGIKGTFALVGVANFLLLYGALRLMSGLVRPHWPRGRRIAGALAAFAAVVLLTFLENSARWDSFELVSLLATSTFYSMTVLASVFSTALAAPLAGAPTRRRRTLLELALLGTAAVSTLTNPLYLGWEAIPLMLVFALLAWRRALGWRSFGRVTAVLAVGAALGLLARIPFAQLITKDGPAYANPGNPGGTAVYYLQLLLDRTSNLMGALELIPVLAIFLIAVVVFRRSVAASDGPAGIIAGMAWLAPLVVVAGMVALGGVGTRYLQPVFFAPLCLVVLVPELFRAGSLARRLSRRALRVLVAAVAAATLVASALVVTALRGSAEATNPDLRCVDDWVTASQRTGAGRFWTIRGPKAYLAEPRQLLQVDDAFGAYPWLTDRSDYGTRAVSFVVSDAQYPPPALPAEARDLPHQTVACGRYSIMDFGSDVLPLGPVNPNGKP
jgi:hypothetical protein